ncbi:TPA: alpha/beta hydrolase, partial [Klebsiella pneumoniae]|nr:alpha/beta hydrolase [Klebsiella pneumoniae]
YGYKKISSNGPVWDRVGSKIFGNFDGDAEIVKIQSSIDNTFQNAYFFSSKSEKPEPLIVSLHTWSGDYNQEDPIYKLAKKKGYNYIHPDFRGANDKPDACLSPKVIQDITDAIKYAKEKTNANNVYLVGVSGGGYAALGYYMSGDQNIKKAFAWVPISNLKDWYIQSKNDKNKYATDVLKCSSDGVENEGSFSKMLSRSPITMTRKNFYPIDIYAGINDGYKGSVSIMQSINFYNKITSTDKITDQEIISLVSRQSEALKDIKIDDRDVFLSRQDNNVSITIFDGVHEMLSEFTMSEISKDALQ